MQASIQYIKKELTGLYPETEVQGFTRIVFEAVCGWDYTQQIMNKNEKLNKSDLQKIEKIVGRLKRFEPIQYILGETGFMDLKLKVNPSVLIPRPETEELIRWVIETKLVDKPRILDIGTGSGCIALALKSRIKNADVSGIDISEGALEIARLNAVQNSLEVDFFAANILNWSNLNWPVFHAIVSNPPYIRQKEKHEMAANVLEYEPENALFVPDDDPLVFYRTIAEFARKQLVGNGVLFFEINEFLGKEMKALLATLNFRNIKIKNDINGKERMVFCEK